MIKLFAIIAMLSLTLSSLSSNNDERMFWIYVNEDHSFLIKQYFGCKIIHENRNPNDDIKFGENLKIEAFTVSQKFLLQELKNCVEQNPRYPSKASPTSPKDSKYDGLIDIVKVFIDNSVQQLSEKINGGIEFEDVLKLAQSIEDQQHDLKDAIVRAQTLNSLATTSTEKKVSVKVFMDDIFRFAKRNPESLLKIYEFLA